MTDTEITVKKIFSVQYTTFSAKTWLVYEDT